MCPLSTFPPARLKMQTELLPELLLISFTEPGIRSIRTESNQCSRRPTDHSWWEGEGSASRTWGPLTTFMGSVPLLTILYLGCLRRISLEPGIVKSRSWRTTGPTQAPFSIDEEMEPRAFKLMARAFSSIPGGSQATPARGHFLPAMPCFPLLCVSPVASSLQACSRN